VNSIIKNIIFMIVIFMTGQLHGASEDSSYVPIKAAGSRLPIIDQAAQEELFNLYYNGVLLANRKAFASLQDKAAADNPLAKAYMAVLHMTGTVLKQDMEKAGVYVDNLCWEWIMAEANAQGSDYSKKRDSPYAQAILGHICLHGAAKVDQSNAKAAAWFESAAMQGHPEAQHILAHMYMYAIGVKQDVHKVAQFLSSTTIRILPAVIRRILLSHMPASDARRAPAIASSYMIVGGPKDPIHEGLMELVQREAHSDAMKLLWESPLPADKNAVRVYIMCMLEDPLFAVKAKGIEMLVSSSEEADRFAARFATIKMVQSPMDSEQWIWLVTLLSSNNENHGYLAMNALSAIATPDRSLEKEATAALEEIAANPMHLRQRYAVRVLGAIKSIAARLVAPEVVSVASKPKKTKQKPAPAQKGKAEPTEAEIAAAARAASELLAAEAPEAKIAAQEARAANAAKEKARKKAAWEAAEAKRQEEARKLAEAAEAAAETAAREAEAAAQRQLAEKAAQAPSPTAQEKLKKEQKKAALEVPAVAPAAPAKSDVGPMAESVPAVTTVLKPTVATGTKLTSPSGNYEVEFLKDEYVHIIIDLKETDYTPEHFFKTVAELLSDDDLGIARTLETRRQCVSSERQPRQAVLDGMVVQAIEEARQTIREHIRAMSGK
jgi:hypothetical protein